MDESVSLWPRRIALPALRYAVLFIFVGFIIVPILWVIVGAFKPANEVLAIPIRLLPSRWQWWNFLEAWNQYPFDRFLLNTVVFTVSIVLGRLFLASLAGYGFAKFKFRGRRVLFLFVLSTMMLPIEVTMIPLFVIVKTFGWVNTYQGLIIPVLLNAFSVFYMRQFILSVPDELIDAARIDGASEFGIFFRIVLPICRPALAGLGVLNTLDAWNAFLWPLLVATETQMFTLPVGLAMFRGDIQRIYFNHILAITLLIGLIPILVYIFAQRYIIESAVLSGMK